MGRKRLNAVMPNPNEPKGPGFSTRKKDIPPRFKVPPIHPKKPEAITYSDFLNIKFPSRAPTLLNDVVEYLTGQTISEHVYKACPHLSLDSGR